MATEIRIPAMGESITEAVVSNWLKPDGTFVRRDEEIVELETDKVSMPLPAPAEGILRHRAGTGQTIAVGALVGMIEEGAAPAPAADAVAPVGGAAASTSAKKSAAPAAAASAEHAKVEAHGSEVRATPLARKVAEEKGVDLSRVPATGPGGRVREHDVLSFSSGGGAGLSGQASAAAAASSGAPAGERGVKRERMSTLRQRIATRLVEAQHTAAMLTTFNECDMTAVMAMRARYKESFEKRHGIKLGFMSFFVKACVSALRKVPAVNSFIVPGSAGGPTEVESHDYCDIAMAVSTDKGLVVPVLRDCQSLSFADIEKGIEALALKARDGKLTLDELQGGTFTITNGGIFGSMMSTPILNPPQSGILGMHNIIRRPVENPDKPGSGEVVVRPMMYLALSYDHRIVDGAGAVGFLKHVKECIEDPSRLMLEV